MGWPLRTFPPANLVPTVRSSALGYHGANLSIFVVGETLAFVKGFSPDTFTCFTALKVPFHHLNQREFFSSKGNRNERVPGLNSPYGQISVVFSTIFSEMYLHMFPRSERLSDSDLGTKKGQNVQGKENILFVRHPGHFSAIVASEHGR